MLKRLDKSELIEVTSDNNLSLLIFGKDLGNEVLSNVSVGRMVFVLRDLRQLVAFAPDGHRHHR